MSTFLQFGGSTNVAFGTRHRPFPTFGRLADVSLRARLRHELSAVGRRADISLRALHRQLAAVRRLADVALGAALRQLAAVRRLADVAVGAARRNLPTVWWLADVSLRAILRRHPSGSWAACRRSPSGTRPAPCGTSATCPYSHVRICRTAACRLQAADSRAPEACGRLLLFCAPDGLPAVTARPDLVALADVGLSLIGIDLEPTVPALQLRSVGGSRRLFRLGLRLGRGLAALAALAVPARAMRAALSGDRSLGPTLRALLLGLVGRLLGAFGCQRRLSAAHRGRGAHERPVGQDQGLELRRCAVEVVAVEDVQQRAGRAP